MLATTDYLPMPIGGIGVFVASVAEAMAQLREDPIVVSSRGGQEIEGVEFVSAVPIEGLGPFNSPLEHSVEPGGLITENCFIAGAPMNRRISAVIGQDIYSGLAAYLLARRESVPFILVKHIFPIWNQDMAGWAAREVDAFRWYIRLNDALLGYADAVVALSEGQISEMSLAPEWSVIRSKVHLVPLAGLADPEIRRDGPENPAGHTGLRVLTVGRLVEDKGISKIIAAIAALSDAELVVVGDGPGRSAMEALTRALGVSDRVRFVGQVPHDEMWKSYDTADVFVSASSREAAGLAIVEAQSVGLPIVAPDFGIPGLVDGVNAVLLNDIAPSSIRLGIRRATALGRAPRDPHLRTWRDVARDLLNIVRGSGAR